VTRLLPILACLLLFGCVSAPSRVTTGERMPPPIGHVLLCNGPDAGVECGK